ncbi:MAG: DNA-directed RNA polymerase subunit omega [Bacteroidales bacterium]|nr:DNA-directed RNA polymerase subunit omega [Candidatus Hennigimonas equi]
MATEKKVPVNTITRDLCELAEPTGNIYETVVILSKRSNQIAIAEKKELQEYLEAVKTDRDTMEEIVENREQIDVSKRFERRPKPSLKAIAEFEENKIFYEVIKEGEE